MKYLIPLFIIAAFIAAVIGSVLRSPQTFRSFKLRVISVSALFCGGLRENFCTANTETAAGNNKIWSRRADAAHSYRYLLVKAGSDDGHVAVCGAGNYPLGSTSDQPAAAEDLLNVHPLGSSDYTRFLRSASALSADVDVYTAANGFIQAEPGTTGTYYKVGRTVQASVQEGSSNYVTQVAPCAPVKLTVIAAASGTAATDIAAIFTAIATPTLLKHA